jgi:ABC-type transport system involved in multi-copper enzyme maturation permease subunit
VWFSIRRQWKVRQVGGVGFALLGVTALVVGVVSNGGRQWRLENERRAVLQPKQPLPADRRAAGVAVFGGAGVAASETGFDYPRLTLREYSERPAVFELLPGSGNEFAGKVAAFAAFRAIVSDDRVRADFAFTNFSRWVVFTLYLAFLLPLFTLAYATGAIGAEREGRTLLWLITRPLPRWAVYLGKLLGMLPWCVGASAFAFAVLAAVGGVQGGKAVAVYWPAVLAGAVAFGCVFHMVGAIFRRPTIVGLVYVFFFETLVANLPGGLKQFSLNYYLKSLFYDRLTTAAPAVRPEGLELYQAADPSTAWAVLILVSVGVTALGAWAFSRQEPKDET